MMHGFFYRCFPGGTIPKPQDRILCGIAAGASLAIMVFMALPDELSHRLLSGLLTSRVSFVQSALSAVLPIFLCAAVCLTGSLTLLPVALSALLSFLLAFSACVISSGSVMNGGEILGLLLLSGRCVCLSYVFWFLLRRTRCSTRYLGLDLCVVTAMTVVTMLIFHWMTIPGIAVFAAYHN